MDAPGLRFESNDPLMETFDNPAMSNPRPACGPV